MTLNKMAIDAILAYFGLPKSLHVARLNGWANQNYLAQTQGGQEFVLKILVLQKQQLLVNDIAIQAQLAPVMQTPVYRVGPQGTVLYEKGALRAVISAKIEGIHAPTLTPAFAFEVGKVVALFHRTVHFLPKPHQGWLNPLSAQRVAHKRSRLSIVHAAQQLINDNVGLLHAALPMGIIHGDLHEQNVLVASAAQPAVIALMDFEEAEENLLLIDLARTILSVCRSPQETSLLPHAMEQLVHGYETGRPLTTKEKELLHTAIRYVIGVEVIWLVQHGFSSEAAQHLARAGALPALGL